MSYNFTNSVIITVELGIGLVNYLILILIKISSNKLQYWLLKMLSISKNPVNLLNLFLMTNSYLDMDIHSRLLIYIILYNSWQSLFVWYFTRNHPSTYYQKQFSKLLDLCGYCSYLIITLFYINMIKIHIVYNFYLKYQMVFVFMIWIIFIVS